MGVWMEGRRYSCRDPGPVDESPGLSDTERRIAEIDSALVDIDLQSIRPARVVAVAIAAGAEVLSNELGKLEALERTAMGLRGERVTQTGEGDA